MGKENNTRIDKKIVRIIFAPENRWGLITGLLIAVIGCVSYVLPKPILFLIYILQAVTVVIINHIFDLFQRQKNKYLNQTIDLITDKLFRKIEDKYNNTACNSTNLFKIFQLNDGGNFYNVTHNIFFNMLIKSYSKNGENRKYYFPIDTYYEVIKEFIRIGYKIKIINGVLLPFWYVPKEKDKALIEYTKFCKENAELYERITYYQDYRDDSWKDDTVRMIYLDLFFSEKSDDIAVRWLITLITNISELKDIFSEKIKDILGIKEKLSSIDYTEHYNEQFNAAIKKNISNVEPFLKQQYDSTTISGKMTEIINNLFLKDMKNRNKIEKKSVIDTSFKNVINFKDVTEVGYYYKEDEGEEYDQFVMFLNGSNTGPSVEIEIITDKDKITNIKQILSELIKKK